MSEWPLLAVDYDIVATYFGANVDTSNPDIVVLRSPKGRKQEEPDPDSEAIHPRTNLIQNIVN